MICTWHKNSKESMVDNMSELNQNSKKKHRKGNRVEEPDLMRAEAEWEKLRRSLKQTSGKADKSTSPESAAGKNANKQKSLVQKRSDRMISDKNSAGKNAPHMNTYVQKAADKAADKATACKGKQAYNSRAAGQKVKKTEGCPHLRDCGGCQVKRQEYPEHLKQKQSQVEELLKKFCSVENIIGMDNPYYYRNKVHAVFDHDRKGNPISGVYEEGTHRVIPVDSCMIHNKKADEIIVSIRNMLKSFKIKTYDEDTGYGLLRHVLVRTGFSSGEIMVVLVLSSPIFPSKNNFVKALRKLHPEITTIILNVNDKATSMILGEREIVIYGKGYIEDTLCGKVFRISPKSFYQVNPVQTEVIYRKAIEFAGLTGKETVVDAYCGIGTISLIAAEHAKKVIGVELNKDAVKDAVINAKRNQTTNVEFYTQDAGEFMSQLAAIGQTAEVVFLDPPRSGCDEKFLNSLCQLNPEHVVYVSCSPVTLERDLQFLTKKGYKARKATPVDMFPWTGHVETVVLMSKVKNEKT